MIHLQIICVASLAIASITSALPATSGEFAAYPRLETTDSQCLDNTTIPTLDDVLVGRYLIENCRHRKAGVVSVLDRALAAIVPALEDAKFGIESTHGFRAFFKYDGAKQYVREMLRQILTLEPKRQLMPNPNTPTSPRFGCAQENSRAAYPWMDPRTDPWIVCRSSAATALYFFGTAYIWFCPRFFNLPTKPTDLTGRNCPIVEDNRFAGNEARLILYQTYVVIHELVHFYLQTHSLSGTTNPPEQYGLDGCVSLVPLHSLHNPTSYQSYIASM